MPDDPFADRRVSEVVSSKARIGTSITEPYPKTTGAAQPPVFIVTDKRATFDITAPAVDDVASADEIPTQAPCILLSNACDALLDDPVVTDVLRHDRRNADGHIVGSVELAAKGSGLDVSPTALAGDGESRVLPTVRGRAD
jgi:hypothetical protein